MVVNAAGVYADALHNMVCEKKIHITPRRGDYYLLDRTTGGYVQHTIFQLPGKYGKGVLVAPTVHGNTIVGPTAIDIEDKDGVNTTAAGLEEVMRKAANIVKEAPLRQVITSFGPTRTATSSSSARRRGPPASSTAPASSPPASPPPPPSGGWWRTSSGTGCCSTGRPTTRPPGRAF